MTVVGIRARFPLGVYRGHGPDRQPDSLPSPLRLHAALVAAAGNGSTAVLERGALSRAPEASRALEWIEDNPPDFVELPDWKSNAKASYPPFAYRDEGVVEKVNTAPSRRKTQRNVTDSTALAGPIGWGWKAIPDEIRSTLETLCMDVPCLGETDSPVVLEVGEVEPTHRRATAQNPFASVAIRLRVPTPGRTEELDLVYERAQPSRTPTVSADKWRATELPAPPPISHDQNVEVGYDEIAPAVTARSPWRHVVHFPVDREIALAERVLWSVTMHRALTAALGDEATPLVTGNYTREAERPTNRIAIQPLPASLAAAAGRTELGDGILVMLPEGGLEALAPVLGSLTRLYRGARGGVRLGRPAIIDAESFWPKPEESVTRLWTAIPAVVPETRRQPSRNGRSWTLGDSAKLSVGFAYLDYLDIDRPTLAGLSATERYGAIVEAVDRLGVSPLSTQRIADSDTGKYVHKLPKGVVAQPYRLTLNPGSLISDTPIVAIGQSRHLGGGLLCPIDIPHTAMEALGYAQ